MRKRFFLPVLVALSLASAQDNAPEKLVDKAIEHAGGWDAWMGTRTIQFRLTMIEFGPDASSLSATHDNYDSSLYSIRNRFYYVSLTKKF